MKPSNIIAIVCLFGLLLLAACKKENEPTPMQPQSLRPIFELGDTLRNNSNTSSDEINIVIDSSSQYGFKLASSYGYAPGHSAAYFIWFVIDFPDPVRVLDSVAKVGYGTSTYIMSTFNFGDTIKPTIPDEGIYDWFPETDYQYGGKRYLKYHIFTPGGSTAKNVKVGDNYFVFKYGDTLNEKMGWLNIVYQDTLCYVKEGYYESIPNQEIIVGGK